MLVYRGLSGVDSALFILACVERLREARRDRNLAFATPVVTRSGRLRRQARL